MPSHPSRFGRIAVRMTADPVGDEEYSDTDDGSDLAEILLLHVQGPQGRIDMTDRVREREPDARFDTAGDREHDRPGKRDVLHAFGRGPVFEGLLFFWYLRERRRQHLRSCRARRVRGRRNDDARAGDEVVEMLQARLKFDRSVWWSS
jgi:hypothetical protein